VRLYTSDNNFKGDTKPRARAQQVVNREEERFGEIAKTFKVSPYVSPLLAVLIVFQWFLGRYFY